MNNRPIGSTPIPKEFFSFMASEEERLKQKLNIAEWTIACLSADNARLKEALEEKQKWIESHS